MKLRCLRGPRAQISPRGPTRRAVNSPRRQDQGADRPRLPAAPSPPQGQESRASPASGCPCPCPRPAPVPLTGSGAPSRLCRAGSCAPRGTASSTGWMGARRGSGKLAHEKGSASSRYCTRHGTAGPAMAAPARPPASAAHREPPLRGEEHPPAGPRPSPGQRPHSPGSAAPPGGEVETPPVPAPARGCASDPAPARHPAPASAPGRATSPRRRVTELPPPRSGPRLPPAEAAWEPCPAAARQWRRLSDLLAAAGGD